MAVVDDLCEHAQLLGLVGRAHRQIWMIPVGQHAEPLEILPLARHLLARIFTAFFTKGSGVELVAHLPVLLLDLPLDRQTVQVTTRHESSEEERGYGKRGAI